MIKEEKDCVRMMVASPGWEILAKWIKEEMVKLNRLDDLVSFESQKKDLDNNAIARNIRIKVTQLGVYKRILSTVEEWINTPGGDRNGKITAERIGR